MPKTGKGIFYEKVEGTGKPVVFVHGWLGSIESWEQVRENLEIGNPLIFYDQRCHGNSFCESFSIDDLARDLKHLVEDLNLEDPVLVGHSMGGMTVLEYSTRWTGFSKLILLGTCASTPEPENGSPSFFLERFGEMDRDEWANKITDNYLGKTSNKELKKQSRTELKTAEEEPIKYGLEAMIEYDIRYNLENSDALAVAGKKDGAITLEMVEELSNLLDSNLEVIDSGHLMLQERPEKISKILVSFIVD